MTPKLAIAIPTYARSTIVRQNLELMIDEASALDVAIYVSDDSPDGDTEAAVRELSTRYTKLHYRKNTPGLGHDANIIQTLLWPDADYVWLLGDSLRFQAGKLVEVHGSLAGEDFLFLNTRVAEEISCKTLEGDEARNLIRKYLWNQTLTGSTIYNKRVLEWTRAAKPEIRKNFPQLSVILAYASKHGVNITWYGKKVLTYTPKTSYWIDSAFSVFVDDWADLVRSYPHVISAQDAPAVIKSHSANTGLFGVRNLLAFRRKGLLRWSLLRNPRFSEAVHVPIGVVATIAMVPKSAINLSFGLARWALAHLGLRHDSRA